MIEAVLSAMLLVLALLLLVFWIRSLVRFDPNKAELCDPEECKSCPFPPDGCRWKGVKSNERGN